MTKAELVSEVAEKSDVTKKQAEAMLKALIDTCTTTLLKRADHYGLTDSERSR